MVLWLAVPLWIPLIFLSYFLGRKQFTLKDLFILVTAESTALGICGLVVSSLSFDLTFTYFEFPIAVIYLMGVTFFYGGPGVITAYAIGRKCFGAGYWTYIIVVEIISLLILCAGLPNVRS
jgi:hypothetical protein